MKESQKEEGGVERVEVLFFPGQIGGKRRRGVSGVAFESRRVKTDGVGHAGRGRANVPAEAARVGKIITRLVIRGTY